MLKPQDVLCACKIYSLELLRQEWSYAYLAREVGLSQSEAHNAVGRCRQAQIITPSGSIGRRVLRDVLAVALPRMCFAVRGGNILGMPTSSRAPVLADKLDASEDEILTVWPCASDHDESLLARGWELRPIYPSVPMAAASDSVVYELLALVDVIRVGSQQKKQIATALTERRLK